MPRFHDHSLRPGHGQPTAKTTPAACSIPDMRHYGYSSVVYVRYFYSSAFSEFISICESSPDNCRVMHTDDTDVRLPLERVSRVLLQLVNGRVLVCVPAMTPVVPADIVYPAICTAWTGARACVCIYIEASHSSNG